MEDTMVANYVVSLIRDALTNNQNADQALGLGDTM